MEDRAKVLDKVRALYAKAASTPYEAEAATFTAKADELMVKLAIDEDELYRSDPQNKKYSPELRTFTYPDSEMFGLKFAQLFSACAQHCRVKIAVYSYGSSKVVGFPGDLDHLDVMFTTLVQHMARTIEPKPDPQLTEAENLYMLRMAGFNWEQVHAMLYPDVPWERRHGVRYTAVMKKHCEANDLPRNKSAMGYEAQMNYRRQFADAYVYRIAERLVEIERVRSQTSDTGLVLAHRADDLTEFMYTLFPEKRPHAADCDCDKCHRCRNPKCDRPRCKLARQPMRYNRGRVTYVKQHAAAVRAGTNAANRADLGQTKVQGNKGAIK